MTNSDFKDAFGNPLVPGCMIMYPMHSTFVIGVLDKITPSSIYVKRQGNIKSKEGSGQYYAYSINTYKKPIHKPYMTPDQFINLDALPSHLITPELEEAIERAKAGVLMFEKALKEEIRIINNKQNNN